MPPLRVRVDDLAFFTVFAECLSFSEAARQLHISQPALHVKIRKLSEQLDTVLYRRFGRQLRLTPHGELVARCAREMQSQAQSLVETLRTGSSHEPVVLGAGTGAYMYLLGAAVQRYLKEASVPLRLLTLDRDQAVQAVMEGKAHLAVTPLETLPGEAESEPLASVGQVLVIPRAHPLANRKKVSLKDLRGCRLVVPNPGQPHREMLGRMLQSAGVPWEIAVETAGWELMMRFVQLGVGVAIVNAYCMPPKGLIAVPIPELPRLNFQLLHLRGRGRDGEVGRLRGLLLEVTAGWRAR
jgi:LysR family transcriptional regulator, low CO2-responsive transcriptional regulator